MNKSLLAKLSILGALITGGCMPDPVLVYTVPVTGTSVTIVHPEPKTVVVVPVDPLPPPRLHYPPFHPRLPYPPVHEFRHEPCPRRLPPPSHRCGR